MSPGLEMWVDGEPATPADLAQVALVNYGGYTSFRAEHGGVRGLDLHLGRLEAEAVELFGQPVGRERLRDLMRASVVGRHACWLRVSLFSPGISPRTPDWHGTPRVLIAVSSPPSPFSDGQRIQLQTYAREAPHLKHVATFGLIRARRTARQGGFDDALFADHAGRISEGSLWNIGFVRGEEIIWPQAPMLAGVAQALVQRGLATVGLTGRSEPVHVDDLPRFDGAFLCNSATPASAIAAIGDHGLPTAPALIGRLRAAWASNPVQPI